MALLSSPRLAIRTTTSRSQNEAQDSGTGTADGVTYVTSTVRIADALTQDVLLTPIEGPRLSVEFAPAGRMYVERRTQTRSSGVAGDSTLLVIRVERGIHE